MENKKTQNLVSKPKHGTKGCVPMNKGVKYENMELRKNTCTLPISIRAKALTDKEKKFIDVYLETLDARKAYITAGYTDNGFAKQNAYNVKNRPIVAAVIEHFLKEYSQELYEKDFYLQGARKLFDKVEKESSKLQAYKLIGEITGHLRPESSGNVGVFVNLDANKLSSVKSKWLDESDESDDVVDAS